MHSQLGRYHLQGSKNLFLEAKNRQKNPFFKIDFIFLEQF